MWYLLLVCILLAFFGIGNSKFDLPFERDSTFHFRFPFWKFQSLAFSVLFEKPGNHGHVLTVITNKTAVFENIIEDFVGCYIFQEKGSFIGDQEQSPGFSITCFNLFLICIRRVAFEWESRFPLLLSCHPLVLCWCWGGGGGWV